MPLSQFFMLHRANHTACHNLCTVKTPPPGTEELLWNGLKFCIEKPLPKPHFQTTMARLRKEIRLKHFWSKRPTAEPTDEYNPKLYIKSLWDPPPASEPLETAMTAFESELQTQIQLNQQKSQRQHNLYPSHRRLLTLLKQNPDFIVLPTDKNLGPAILERDIYKQRCLQDHLLDTSTYRQLEPWEAHCQLQAATQAFKHLVTKHKKCLPDSEVTYFDRAFEEDRRMPQFYCTPKVHKKPKWKTRPIVSCVNSRMGDLAKWVDVQLQQVVHLCPGHLKDSYTFLEKLRALPTLPPSTFLVTADAVSMYTNINTDHALQTLENWLTLHREELPVSFPTAMVLDATKLVMRNNVFQFDDTRWIQLTGTAMGSNLAVMYATIYYSYHEETCIIPTLQQGLFLYGRLVDDAAMVLDSAKLPEGVTKQNLVAYLTELMQFGDLEWEVEPPSQGFNFLDLKVQLTTTGTMATRTFIKPMNLHLFIPPKSAHPKGVLKSLIFGNLNRFWIQNTEPSDYVSTTAAFHQHLLNRGYTPEELDPLFLEAADNIDRRQNTALATHTRTSANSIFVHWEYHPRDISRQAIRQTFNAVLGPALAEANLPTRPTIAYSVPQNIGQCITRTQMQEPEGQRVSSCIQSWTTTPANL